MKLALAGGGTGGHAYPSLAVAEQLRDTAELVYLGTPEGPERALAEDAGIPYRPVRASQIRGRTPWRLMRGSVNFVRGTGDAVRWLKEDRPDAVFVTGGYAAAPVGRAARKRRIPVLLFLPDVRPGWAVRYLARKVTTVACSVPDSLTYFPGTEVVVTGYPVRKQFAEATREGGIERFGLDPAVRTLLVTGGSQGAHHVNLVVARSLRRLLDRLQMIHVCGRAEEDWLRRERERLPAWQQARYHLLAYTSDMAWAMAAADLAVTRAGASVLGELPAIGLPAIMIPLDLSDQRLNANYLAGHGAALLLEDDQLERLEDEVVRLLDDDAARQEMAAAMQSLAKPDAARQLAELLKELAA